MYTLDVLELGKVSVPAPVVMRLSRYGDRVDLKLLAFLLRSRDSTVLVDAGMTDNIIEINEALAESVGAWCRYEVADDQRLEAQLAAHDVDPADVDHVFLTHLHHDHVGGIAAFPNARIVVSHREWLNFTQPSHPKLAPRLSGPSPSVTEHLMGAGPRRLVLVGDREEEVVPGICTRVIGGHTAGSIAVVAQSHAGQVIFAGDNVMIYDNLENEHPPGSLDNLEEALHSLAWLLGSGAEVVPSHDPRVLSRNF